MTTETAKAIKPKKPPKTKAPEVAKEVEWKPITADDKTKLVGTIGIELCAQPPGLTKEKNTDVDYALADGYAAITGAKLAHKKFTVNEAHGDFNSVEVSSVILRTWGAVKKFYDTVTGITLELGCTPHSEHHVSGGGHIHVGDLSNSECVNLIRVLQNRPYIAWVFNDPDDSKSANSFCEKLREVTGGAGVGPDDFDEDEDDYESRSDFRRARDSWVAKKRKQAAEGDNPLIRAATLLNFDVSPLLCGDIRREARIAMTFYSRPEYVKPLWLPSTKDSYLRWESRQKTLEFRFFQAPLNWEEQMAHLKFVEAIILWVRKEFKDKHEVTRIDTEEKLKAITLEQSQEEFLKFLDILGLPHKPYARMIVENLPDRFKRGERK